MPSAQQLIVDEAQAARNIDIRKDDQVAAVLISLEIAIDTPIAIVSPLITSFHIVTVFSRRRSKGNRATNH